MIYSHNTKSQSCSLQFSGLSNRHKFDFPDLDVSIRNHLMWGTRHESPIWLLRSWETIEANNGMEELNKPLPWSSFENLCPTHYQWKDLLNEDSMTLWLAPTYRVIMKDIAWSTPWLRPWMSTILKFINPIKFWLENTFLVLPCF